MTCTKSTAKIIPKLLFFLCTFVFCYYFLSKVGYLFIYFYIFP
ncbi:unnamed protein product [Spodoptera exigua]|nr:unnamed protein product [Spodoptera exigua]